MFQSHLAGKLYSSVMVVSAFHRHQAIQAPENRRQDPYCRHDKLGHPMVPSLTSISLRPPLWPQTVPSRTRRLRLRFRPVSLPFPVVGLLPDAWQTRQFLQELPCQNPPDHPWRRGTGVLHRRQIIIVSNDVIAQQELLSPRAIVYCYCCRPPGTNHTSLRPRH